MSFQKEKSKSQIYKMKSKFLLCQNEDEILRKLSDSESFDFINYRDECSNTVLHYAASKNFNKAIIQYIKSLQSKLFENKIDKKLTVEAIKFRVKEWINSRNQDGLTALHFACLKGNIEAATYLMKKGARIHEVTETGQTMLHMAVQGKSIKMLNYLKNRIDINACDDHGATVLHWACAREYEDIVKFLLEESTVYIDYVDIEGRTPLYLAVEKNNCEIVKLLLAKGASIKKYSRITKMDPLELAQEEKNSSIAGIIKGEESCVKGFFRKVPGIFLIHLIILFVILIDLFISFQRANPHGTQEIIQESLVALCILSFICLMYVFFRKAQLSSLKVIEEKKIFQLPEQDLEKFCFACKCFQDQTITHCRFCDVCVKNRYKHSNLYNKCFFQKNINKLLTFTVLFVVLLSGEIYRSIHYLFFRESDEISLLLKENKEVKEVIMIIFLTFTIPLLFFLKEIVQIIHYKYKKKDKPHKKFKSQREKSKYLISGSVYLQQDMLNKTDSISEALMREQEKLERE